MAREFTPKVVTANALIEGDVVYLTADDRWTRNHAEAELIEAQVLGTSPIAGQRIRDIAFPEGVLVGGVLKDGRMTKIHGALRIEEGDIVALFAMASDVSEVERLLQVSIDFF